MTKPFDFFTIRDCVSCSTANWTRKVAPMDCAMVYWGDNMEKFRSVFSSFDAVMT